MNTDNHLFLMRNLYIGLLAETMARYAKAGILNEIEKEKKTLSLASGEKNAQMLGVTKPEEAFTKPASIVDCASWEISINRNGLKAVCVGCKLAAMCKKLETPSPCRMYCLNAIEGMIKALKPEAVFNVKSTLWSGKNCTVRVTW
ncbi:hypothetical protein ACFL1R_05875 [Candidatus Latescibacterota bacterium]